MSGKVRITITVDPHLVTYAERLVALGKVPSVSAAFNDAFAAKVERDREARRWWHQKAAEAAADPEGAVRVDRVVAHLNGRLREFEQERDRLWTT
jgi:Arc/MetJ-type ribon-helix-helix transcriptional regulator